MCVRVTRLGYKLVFNPAVRADHVGAAQTGVRRFSPKYSYFHAKNNLVMLMRNFGLCPLIWRHCRAIFARGLRAFSARIRGARASLREERNASNLLRGCRKIIGAFAFFGSEMAGLVSGFAVGAFFLLRTGTRPERNDEQGRQISAALSQSPHL